MSFLEPDTLKWDLSLLVNQLCDSGQLLNILAPQLLLLHSGAFAPVVPSAWKALPLHVCTFASLTSFKCLQTRGDFSDRFSNVSPSVCTVLLTSLWFSSWNLSVVDLLHIYPYLYTVFLPHWVVSSPTVWNSLSAVSPDPGTAPTAVLS